MVKSAKSDGRWMLKYLVHPLEYRTVANHLGAINYAVHVPFSLPSERSERLHFARKKDAVSGHGVVQWLDPETIPRSIQ